MAAHIIEVERARELETELERPGGMTDPELVASGRKSTRFLGWPDEDPVTPERPPYAFHIRRPKGDITPDHSHAANRIEFLIEGRIEWREQGKAAVEYGAGTLTYVDAGTVYGYEVLEDATILIIFEKSPGMNYR
jgi:quercetin dioxygenase-like cupin family protein